MTVSAQSHYNSKVARPPQPSKRTLLIVDDDEGPRKSLELIFRNAYEVLLADSGDEALRIVREHPVDTAILDIRMFGMSGIELLEKIKIADPTIEAIMLTGYETIETIRQSLRFGACDYLSKPYDIETIRASVANAMERRSLSDEIRSTHQRMTSLQIALHQQAVSEEITRNKGEIYASILHDINGPLTIIAGYVQLINQDLEKAHLLQGPEVDNLKDHLRLINRQVNHCVEISQRYLGFLRNKPGERTATKVNKVFDDLESLLRGNPNRGAHRLSIEKLSEDAIVWMNGADLVQVLLNLSINALQATPAPHDVRIKADIKSSPLNTTATVGNVLSRIIVPEKFENRPPFLCITVEDNGPGITAETLAKIFEPFFTTKADKGTGLGLSIVKRLVNEAGGAIYVESRVNHGTTFRIYLPAA